MSPNTSTPTIDRRQLLAGTAAMGTAGALTGVPGWTKPAFALVRSGRPGITHGVQAGDVTAESAVVWARTDRPARLLVEVSTSPSFRHTRTFRGPVTDADADFAGR